MFKRVTIVALVVAAFVLIAAVPAFAFNGMRGDYTTTAACAACHSGIAGIPTVYPDWSDTKHAESGASQASRLPYGSVCGGCHVANYDPSKVVPTPTATNATTGAVSWAAANGTATEAQADGSAASSESFVGCSSCHYGANVPFPGEGVDTNDTAHSAPFGELANADICGQCHSRYSYTVDTFPVAAVDYTSVTLPLPGTPITPNPSPTTEIQPQMALGYPMLGAPGATGWDPAAPLSDVLNIPMSGWSPTPIAGSSVQTYWKDLEGNDLLWQQQGHDGSAAQYPEWANEGHAVSLDALKAVMGPNPPARCLECHSADYRIAVEAGKTPPTGAQAKYGITCVGCHTPHEAGSAKGAWDEEFDVQLIGDPENPSDLCTTCHNGEIAEGESASPGDAVHHPMKEMMDGYGAVDVAGSPSVHKGKCVKCHMPPTSWSGHGGVQRGGNHTFTIIEPEVAAEVQPFGDLETMPYSACSTCHGGQAPGDPLATYLQDTIEQRQAWTHAKIDAIWAALDVAAVNLGYADIDAAHSALVAIPAADRTTAQTAFLSAFTNVEFVETEGSFGIHNWRYSSMVVNKAMEQAKVAQTGVVVKLRWVVTFKMSKSKVRAGTKVTFSGTVKTAKGVPGSGRVKILKRVKGVWKVWQRATLNSSGSYKLTKKMTTKGDFRLRAFMPEDDLNLARYSRSLRLIVK